MKKYENGWVHMDKRTACEKMGGLDPDFWLIGKVQDYGAVNVMDFGCGLGRNSFEMADLGMYVTMYDFPNIISMMKQSPGYRRLSHMLSAEDRWMNACMKKYDVVLASLVFQHMPAEPAAEYLECMSGITDRLLVSGRSHMDFNGGLVIDVLGRYFDMDDRLMSQDDIANAMSREENKHFWAWMRPKGGCTESVEAERKKYD